MQLNRAQKGAGRRRALAGATLAAAFLAFGLASANSAHATSLAIHSPPDGANLSAPPPDVTGEWDNNIVIWIPQVNMNVERLDLVGGGDHVFTLYTNYGLGCFCDDWSYMESFDDPDDEIHNYGATPDELATYPDGKYRITARQPPTAFNPVWPEEEEVTTHFILDRQVPDTEIDLGPNEFDNDTTPIFEFSGSDPDAPALSPGAPNPGFNESAGSGIGHYQCRLNGGAWDSCVSGAPYPAPEGQNKFEVRAVDKAGNADPTPAVHEWMVDITPPDISFGVPPKSRFLLHQGSVPFTCTDPLSGGPPPVASGIATCNANGFNNEDLGPHKRTVNATDRAGNPASASLAYVIDPPKYGDFVDEDDPVAYYRHSEPLPGPNANPQEITMEDSSGNGHDGTYKNNVALQRTGAIACGRRPHPPRVCETAGDPENRAAFFPERDGYGYANGIPSSPTGYTMEAWVKPRTSGPMMVMSHGRAGQLFIDHNQRLAFEQSQDTVSSPGPNIPVGDWTHVAATWDGHNTRLYVNGVEVAHSTTTNKEPSGSSTFYVGNGEKAPWFHGEIDESALYDYALSAHRIHDRNKIGRATDNPSVEAGNSPFNTEGPFTDPAAPKNGGVYAPNKTPKADFECTDPDDVPGNSDVASCTAEVDGNPIADGDPLPDSPGTHMFIVTAVDEGGNEYVHPHQYFVKDFSSLYGHDNPVAYYRLGDGPGTHMQDSSPNQSHGEYKNDQDQGPVGIAGDGDTARDFRGAGGYGYANGISAPKFQMTLEAWIEPDDFHRDQSIAGHGDGGELYLEGGVLKFRHGPQNRVVSASPPYAPNPNSSYTQVVGTWDGVDLRIYVNGELEGTVESNRGPTSNSTFYVGYGELKPWFDGRIDEVAYYATALNPNRVYQHFLADPAADERAGGGSGPGSGGSNGSGTVGSDSGGSNSGDAGNQGSAGAGSGGAGSAGDGAEEPEKLGLRLGRSVTAAGRTAMVPVHAGEEPAAGAVALATGKTKLGSARFDLDAGEDAYVDVKLKKKGRKLLRKKRSVTVTLDADTGTVSERLRVAR